MDVWWYDGGELPPDAIREPVGTRFPEQGSIVVGTDGLIVLPHGTADAFVLPESKMAALPTDRFAGSRITMREFIDVVLGGGKAEVLGELRLRRSADRIGDHRQRRGAISRARRWSSTRERLAFPKQARGEPVPDAQLSQRLETKLGH